MKIKIGDYCWNLYDQPIRWINEFVEDDEQEGWRFSKCDIEELLIDFTVKVSALRSEIIKELAT